MQADRFPMADAVRFARRVVDLPFIEFARQVKYHIPAEQAFHSQHQACRL